MDSLQARLETLEQEWAAGKRSLRWWRGMTALAVAGALCLVPLGAQSDPNQSVSHQVAALQQQVAMLQTALNNETAARQASDAALQNQVTPLATKLEKVSIQQIDGCYSIVIDGANLHLRNGLGATNGNPAYPFAIGPVLTQTNGLGNLIIGYNELRNAADDRSGSHNLVIGLKQNFSSFGGLVAGRDNNVTAPFAAVSGGERNLASGLAASVSGGGGNTASGGHASVSGGSDNTASGGIASVSGGDGNTASGFQASVSGGSENTASGEASSVGGGAGNTASGPSASVSGGGDHTASGFLAWMGGGFHNFATGEFASVSGGVFNTAAGARSAVSGGLNRQALGVLDWVAGGLFQDQ
jgi:hypothetical protein